MGRLIITRRGPEDGVLYMSLSGSLDDRYSPLFADALEAAYAHGVRHIKVDLTAVDPVTSTGIATLVAAIEDFNQRGMQVQVTNICDKAAQMMEILGLLDIVCWAGREEEETES